MGDKFRDNSLLHFAVTGEKMATSFQLYIDKENTPLKHREGSGQPLGIRGTGITPSVKIFADRDSSLTRSGPRSALKDVNSIITQPKLKGTASKDSVRPVQELFKKPAPRTNDFNVQKKSDRHQKSKINSGLDGKHRVVNKIAEALPEKEYMHIFNENEEIKPRQDPDFTGLVGRIRRWKPPCFFGGRQDSDSEDEVVEDPFNDLSPPEPQDDFEPLEFLDLDTVDIPIPNIDKDLPIPYLDDSLDIEPNLGTLEIYDSSTSAQQPSCAK